MIDAIYLDNHATTPVDPRVLDAMLPFFGSSYGNSASRTHVFGRAAEAAVETAREQVAEAIGARYSEIVFTAGATESNAIALKGVGRGHLVTTAIEHRAVLDTCRRLESQGWDLTVLPVDRFGMVDPEAVRGALRPDTVVVSVMAANNEIGTIQPLAEIGAVVKGSGALFHVDAAQAVGRIPLDVEAMGIDLLSMSAHKLYGPKGIGALYIRRKIQLQPLMEGGGQERGIRPGTLNVPGIVGLGEACRIAVAEMAAERDRLTALRLRLLERLSEIGVVLNGHPESRLAGNLNVSIDGVESEALLLGFDKLAVSVGAACSSGLVKASAVLQAIGAATEGKRASLRFGIGRFNTADDIERAAQIVIARVKSLRSQ